jgi:hypothetical protein
MRLALGAISIAVLALSTASLEAAEPTKKQTIINPPPSAQDWADLAKLPDWSGVWNPKITDQDQQVKTNPPPWNEKAAKQIEHMFAEEKAGRPPPIFVECLPEAMPSWMLVTHNAMEFLFTPGRVTILGESDGNRLRRIYTDGRPHPDDPDPTFHGHSIGHWEGDMHIIERIHLAAPDILHDELEIIAPHVLTKPWKTTRIYFRQRARKFDIVEGVCLEGNYSARSDKDGNSVFVPIARQPWGNLVAPDAKR